MGLRSLLPFPRVATELAPSDPFVGVHRDMDRMFSDVWRGFGLGMPAVMGEVAAMPRLDVKETDRSLLVQAELPGVDEKDIELELTGRTLSIRGEKKKEEVKDEKGYHLSERSYGSFLRSLQLPYEVDPAKIEASFAKGVLTVTIAKPQSAVETTKKITVKAA